MNRTFVIIIIGLSILSLAGCASALPNADVHAIGVQRLEYAAAGSGNPTVIFESGMAATMDSWIKVLPEVAQFTHVFAYNRPGYGRSKPRMGPATGTKLLEKLHNLLAETGQRPPYILIGHSFGGLFANLYARTYPDEVVGVVFVDSAHPDQESWWWKHRPVRNAALTEFAVFGMRYGATPAEFFDTDDVIAELKAAGPFPAVPLTVITAGKATGAMADDEWSAQWLIFQKDLAALSPQSKHIIAAQSSHFIMDTQPELVIEAIREMVESLNKPRSPEPGTGTPAPK